MAFLDPNRLLLAGGIGHDLAKNLYDQVKSLPIISPHGHCNPKWFARNRDSQIHHNYL